MKYAHTTIAAHMAPPEPLPMRRGDALVWLRNEAGFASSADYRPLDIWFLGGGETVHLALRSNRLPPWYDLHPTEMAGILAHRYHHEPDSPPPVEPLEGPGIWKVRAGDKLLLVLVPRPTTGVPGGMCCVFDFMDNCMVWATDADSRQPDPSFASVPISPESEAFLQPAIHAGVARANGQPPRSISMDWFLES